MATAISPSLSLTEAARQLLHSRHILARFDGNKEAKKGVPFLVRRTYVLEYIAYTYLHHSEAFWTLEVLSAIQAAPIFGIPLCRLQ